MSLRRAHFHRILKKDTLTTMRMFYGKHADKNNDLLLILGGSLEQSRVPISTSARTLPPTRWDQRERTRVSRIEGLSDVPARRRVFRQLTELMMKDIFVILSSIDVSRRRVDAVA